MARTSKKKQTVGNGKAPSKVYTVGIYARLSVDADERKNESIETQIEIAKAFLKGQEDMVLYDCYRDVGKTGTDFKREGFERMMQDVRSKRIDCIIVKDLSRFGRNHIETGNYIEKIFPFMGVRFIAVTDRFDSLYPAGKGETLGVDLKNLVNEMYARDIAFKVKTSKQAKWEQGSYTGGVPPYGYRAEWIGDRKCLFPEDGAAQLRCKPALIGDGKCLFPEDGTAQLRCKPALIGDGKCLFPEDGTAQPGCTPALIGDRKCLFPEAGTADVVKRIYERFVSGESVSDIVKWLYQNRVVRPVLYRQTGKVFAEEGEPYAEWSKATVKRILTNPVYTGCLVQGRTCGKDYRNRERNTVEAGDWSVKEHTHEPLVSGDLFSEAAARLEETAKYSNRKGFSRMVPMEEDIFAGVLFCGDCGAKLQRIAAVKEFHSGKRVRTYSYNCPNVRRIDTEKCVSKSITQKSLEELVKEAVRQEFSLSAMSPKALVEANCREAEKQKMAWNTELLRLQKKLEGTRLLGSEEYIKYRGGGLDEDGFRKKKEENDKKIRVLKKKKEELEERMRVIDQETMQKNHFLKNLVKGSEKAELTAEAVQTLVERIEVWQDRRVRIIFRFQRGKEQVRTEGSVSDET